jgi:hypothetical protein
MKKRTPYTALFSLPLLAALLVAAPVHALTEISDSDLTEVTGEGVALTLENISLRMGPTSYFELTGNDELTGSELNFRRGDLRWYGISYTGKAGTPGQAWSGSCVNNVTNMNMGCPLGGVIAQLAPHDNPLLMRAFDYKGVNMAGVKNQVNSVFETLYPSNHERYRYSFWGEINVGTGTTVGTGNTMGSTKGTGSDKLQVLNIWNNVFQGGTLTRLFQTTGAETNGKAVSLGIQNVNHFEADVRMAVAQTMMSPDTLGQTPEFDSYEGLYIGDYRVHMVAGQLHYQQLVLDEAPAIAGLLPAQSGNFEIRLTQIPNTPNVYNTFYGRTSAADPTGGFDRSKMTGADYNASHGYVRMGDWAPQHKPNLNAAGNTGIAYSAPSFNSKDAPISSMPSESTVSSCIADRPTCTKNGSYDTNNGLFFIASPGQTFQVFTRSPNYMYDSNVNDNLNDNDLSTRSVSVTATDRIRTRGGNLNPILSVSRINLGDVNIQGMVMHSLTITSLGAQ